MRLLKFSFIWSIFCVWMCECVFGCVYIIQYTFVHGDGVFLFLSSTIQLMTFSCKIRHYFFQFVWWYCVREGERQTERKKHILFAGQHLFIYLSFGSFFASSQFCARTLFFNSSSPKIYLKINAKKRKAERFVILHFLLITYIFSS